jgi:RsiW-degrading membrane proteinase PrsW (M82 family)
MRGLLTSGAVCLGVVLGGLTGCAPPLVGTNDAAVDFRVERSGSGPAATPDTVSRVKNRLDAAQIATDVDVITDDTVRVVVDAEAVPAVEQLVAWRGGIEAYRVDDEGVFDPASAAAQGLRARARRRPDGSTERWWEGSADAVARAVSDAKLDPRHMAFAERLGEDVWRTRVVHAPAVEVIGLRHPFTSIDLAARGRALALLPASDDRAVLSTLRASHRDATITLARGRTLLATVPIDAALATPLILPFGDDLRAFAVASDERRLLESPVLPALRRTAAQALPTRWGLALACALLPFALSMAWLLFVRRFDRARPEPWWLVLATFALGCLSVVPAAAAEAGWIFASPWLDPSLVTFGGQAWSLPIAIPVFVLVVGLSEEAAKLLAAWSLAGHRPEFDEPVDGIVYGCAAALGFAAAENVKYFAVGRLSGTLVALRGFITVPAHMFFGALWGYAWGRSLVSRRSSVLLYLLLAALVHGSFDALLSIDGAQYVAALVVPLLGVAFFVMLRRLLRHGAVRRPAGRGAPATEPLPASALPRAYFRVGSSARFAACAAGMLTLAFALVVLGMAYENLHERVNLDFVAIASLILALFGLAAYGVTATIPLDAAVDAQGVTYAGRRVPWGAVFGVALDERAGRTYVVVRSAGSDLRIGPIAGHRARALADAILVARGP